MIRTGMMLNSSKDQVDELAETLDAALPLCKTRGARMKYLFCVVICCLCLVCAAFAQTAVTLPTPVTSRPEVRQKTFEAVWQTIKDKYFDPQLNGVDWAAVRVRYEPLAQAAKDDQELVSLLNRMLGELRQSHSAVIANLGAYIARNQAATGGLGLQTRYLAGQAVVTKVTPASPAARAGWQSGFVIKSINGETVEQLTAAKQKTAPPGGAVYAIEVALGRALTGKSGETVRLEYLDAKNKRREVTLTLAPRPGELFDVLGGVKLYAEFESTRLPGGFGYLRLSNFWGGLSERLREAMRGMKDAPGLIIDVRGNSGGDSDVAHLLMGSLLEQTIIPYQTLQRDGLKLRPEDTVTPDKEPYTGPLIVLQDGLSASASEVFAGALQDLRRAVVVGSRSSGQVLGSTFSFLPNGGLLVYPISQPVTLNGVILEGRGVKPDVEVNLTRSLLLKKTDPQLAAALAVLQKMKPKR